MQEGQPDFSLADAVRTHILQTLVYCGGNRTRAARRLGISIRCLRDKLRCYSEAGIEIPGPPAADDDTGTAHRGNFDGVR
jgi:two-component system, response regulator FlrC